MCDSSIGFGILVKNFERNEIYHHVPHVLYGKYVCYNHCLLQYHEYISLCHMEFYTVSQFYNYDQGQWKCITVS